MSNPTAGTPGQAVSNAAPGPRTDSPAEALGRRILSTAFVRIGPDDFLTIGLSGGRTLVLRDVVMRPTDYCGVQATGDSAGRKYCGGYAGVATARPGGAPVVTPVEPAPGPARPR